LRQGLLTIRATKFGKSRLVPLHASTTAVLTDYQQDALQNFLQKFGRAHFRSPPMS